MRDYPNRPPFFAHRFVRLIGGILGRGRALVPCLRRARAVSRPILVLHRAALELVDDIVHGGAVRGCACLAPQRVAIDHERDLDDVALVDIAAMLLAQLDIGLAPIIQHALEPLHLALDIGSVRFGDGCVAAPDRGSHSMSPSRLLSGV